MKLKLPTFLALIVLLGLFALINTATAQQNVSLGCCTTVEGTPACVGCGEGGANCAVDGSLCVETNSFTLDEVCVESAVAGQAECRPPEGNGCCVRSPESCVDDVSFDACSAMHWFQGTSCSSVQMCAPAPPHDITDKIIIVLAVLIVIVLLILFRRKKPKN